MRERFQKIPPILQKQILIRLAGSALGVIMVALVLAYRGSFQFLLPGIMTTLIFLALAASLFIRCSEGAYVVIKGACEEIERSSLRKKIKAIHIRCDDKAVKIVGQLNRLRNLHVGDSIEAYLSDSAPIYEHDGIYVVTSILAIRKER